MRWIAFLLLFAIAMPAAAEPAEQMRFGDTIRLYHWKWWGNENEIQRAEMIGDRGRDLRENLPATGAFADWEMEVLQVGVDNQGHAYITLKDLSIGTAHYGLINLSVGDSDPYRQRLELGSPIYAVARTLNKGDRVIVSGVLFESERTGLVDASAAMKVNPAKVFLNPMFAARYTAMRKLF